MLGLIAIVIVCLLCIALAKAALLRLVRSNIRYGRCVLLALTADTLSSATAVLAVMVFFLFASPPFLRAWQVPREPPPVYAYFPPSPSSTQLTVHSLPVTPEPSLMPTVTGLVPASDAAQQALAYLQRQYNPQVGLLRESPSVAPHKYWLATDNLAALYALRVTGRHTLADEIGMTYARYGSPIHGLLETLSGQMVTWPPYVETQQQIATVGTAAVWLETRTVGAQYQDWAEYADLALYAALNAQNLGQSAEARRLYQDAMRLFDSVGFADKAFRANGVYATYKLALAIYVAQAIGEPVDARLWPALLTKQASTGAPEAYVGGFYTLYNRQGQPLNDPNTETTAYALLALSRGAPVMPAIFIPVINISSSTPLPMRTPPASTATRLSIELSSAIERGVGFLKH